MLRSSKFPNAGLCIKRTGASGRFTIFITENDFYGMGKAAYTIQRINLTAGKPFDDSSYILYVNGEYQGDDDLGRLMHDFNCTDAKDMNFEMMENRTRYLKENPEGVETMCKAMEDMREQAREEGRTEGKTEGLNLFAALIRKLAELGRMNDIERAATDANYREQLLAEFALQ